MRAFGRTGKPVHRVSMRCQALLCPAPGIYYVEQHLRIDSTELGPRAWASASCSLK